MTGTSSNRKGYNFMRSICTWLNANGWPYATIRSKGQSGSDILETPGITWELKAVQKTSLGAWLDQVQQDAYREDADIAAVVHKRRGTTDPAEQFVTIDLATFNRLLIDAAYTTGPPRPLNPTAPTIPRTVLRQKLEICCGNLGDECTCDDECKCWCRQCACDNLTLEPIT